MHGNFVYHTSVEPSSGYHIHYHFSYEIYYFLEGDVNYLVEGKEYTPTPHSLILLSPNAFHGVKINSSSPYTRCAIHFDASQISSERRSLLLSCFPNKQNRKEIFYENTKDFQLYSYMRSIVETDSLSKETKNQYYSIYLEALLAKINTLCNSLTPSYGASTVSETIANIINYINENLSLPLSLDELSNHFFISKYYMNRAFKKATGTTIMEYIIYKRILMAKQYLLDGESATDAALRSGFGDYSVFYRAYKKIMGHSPNKDKTTPF